MSKKLKGGVAALIHRLGGSPPSGQCHNCGRFQTVIQGNNARCFTCGAKR